MGQMGFFDLRQRYEGLDTMNNPLMRLDAAVPWERFRGKLEAALSKAGARKTAEERKCNAGRPPWDGVLMFKVLVLAALYNLADDQMESTAEPPGPSRSPTARSRLTRRARRCVPGSSTCSATRRTPWAVRLCAPSASSTPR